MTTDDENDALQVEIAALRELLARAGLDAARLLAQAGIDATDNEAAKRLQRLLLEEMHHRIKNTLATVVAITSQSLRNAKNLEEGRLAVENRLMAIGRAHDMLLEANLASAELRSIVLAAIRPFDDQKRIAVRGAPLNIGATAVLPLAMFFNELCTNAVKYGALSDKSGQVMVTWMTEEQSKSLNLTWTESNGPAVQEPASHGFGTRLVNRLAEQLHGNFQIQYDHQGIACKLIMPLASLH